MREIKFRAWDKADGLHRDYDCMSYFTTKNFLNGDYDVLMQYTGLKDKNGVEIYEGDIIKHTSNLIQGNLIEYSIKSASYDGFPINSYGNIDLSEYKVIGNIYENPELLQPVTPN